MRGGVKRSYSIFFRSVWQTPQASTRTRSSPAPISGVGTFSIETTRRPLYTAAHIVPGTTFTDASASERAVSNEFSKRSRGYMAPFMKLKQLRRYCEWALYRGGQNARRTEPAV